MRQILTILALVFAAFSFSGCAPTSSFTPATYSMTANVGPVSFNSTMCIASSVTDPTDGVQTLGITGTTVSGGVGGPPIIALTIPDWNGGACYTEFYDTKHVTEYPAFGQYTPSGGGFSKMSVSGSVTVSTVTATTITGSFNFVCEDGTTVAGGLFTAKRY